MANATKSRYAETYNHLKSQIHFHRSRASKIGVQFPDFQFIEDHKAKIRKHRREIDLLKRLEREFN